MQVGRLAAHEDGRRASKGRTRIPGPAFGTEEQHKTSFLLPTLYAVVPLTAERQLRAGDLRAVRPRVPLGQRRAVLGPLHRPERGDPVRRTSTRFSRSRSRRRSRSRSAPTTGSRRSSSSATGRRSTRSRSRSWTSRTSSSTATSRTTTAGAGTRASSGSRSTRFSLGAAYRSKIKVDYEGTGKFTQRPTGNAAFDAAVAAQLPQGKQDVAVDDRVSRRAVNLGAAINLPGRLHRLARGGLDGVVVLREPCIDFPNDGDPGPRPADRTGTTPGPTASASRRSSGACAVRAGYYFDKTPQPIADVGPILADADRNVYTLGFGYNTDRWGVDVSDVYIKFKEPRHPRPGEHTTSSSADTRKRRTSSA